MKPGDLVRLSFRSDMGCITLWADTSFKTTLSCGMMERGELGIVVASATDANKELSVDSPYRDQLLVLVGERLGWSVTINFTKANETR